MVGRLLQVIVLLTISSVAQAAEVVKLYDYHRFPPFVIGTEQGLTYDFANYLSKQSGGAYDVRVEILPRNRFNVAIVEDAGAFLSPWLMPDWLDDAGMTKYLWGNVLMHDSDDVLSSVSQPFDYSGPESLAGQNLGIVLGYQYPVIEPYLSTGKIRRVDMGSEEQIVMMIAYDRIKVGLVPDTAARYFIRQGKFQNLVHISARPLYSYDRRVLMHGPDAWLKFLRRTIDNAPRDPAWLAMLQSYGLTN